MPTYIYEFLDDGTTFETVMSISEMERFQKGKMVMDGRGVRRRVDLEHGGFKDTPGNWPMLCEASGVHPDQVREATEHARRLGVPTDFTPDGRAILRDRAHRRDYNRAHGFYDRNGGYGD